MSFIINYHSKLIQFSIIYYRNIYIYNILKYMVKLYFNNLINHYNMCMNYVIYQ